MMGPNVVQILTKADGREDSRDEVEAANIFFRHVLCG